MGTKTITEEDLKKAGQELSDYPCLVESVIDWVTEDGEEYIKGKFEDLLNHGCVSGMVGHLIYYTDTHEFYDEYYDEIETLREYLGDNLGTLEIKGDLKNWFAWCAFEEIARMLYQIINPEW